MPTFTALTTLTGKSQAEGLGDAMERLTPEPTGIGVFEVEDGSGLWEVGGYFTDQPDESALALMAAAFDAKPFVVSELPETDWVAHVRRELKPVVAGRFFVYGSHDADQVPTDPDVEPLLIEAAMVEEGGFKEVGAVSVAHAAFIGLGAKPVEIAAPLEEEPPVEVLRGLHELISKYLDETQGFTARRIVKTEEAAGDYDQLARFGAWDVTTDPTPEDLT